MICKYIFHNIFKLNSTDHYKCITLNKSKDSLYFYKLFSLGSISPTCLHTAFRRIDSKSAKRQSRHQCLFALLGSVYIKAARKTLVKLTPDHVYRPSFFTKFRSYVPSEFKRMSTSDCNVFPVLSFTS